jgi:hypothetical protein
MAVGIEQLQRAGGLEGWQWCLDGALPRWRTGPG